MGLGWLHRSSLATYNIHLSWALYSSTWHGSAGSYTLKSPLQHGFHLHGFIQWPFKALQGLQPCHTLPGLTLGRKSPWLPRSCIFHVSRARAPWMTVSRLIDSLGWTPPPQNTVAAASVRWSWWKASLGGCFLGAWNRTSSFHMSGANLGDALRTPSLALQKASLLNYSHLSSTWPGCNTKLPRALFLSKLHVFPAPPVALYHRKPAEESSVSTPDRLNVILYWNFLIQAITPVVSNLASHKFSRDDETQPYLFVK